MWEQLKSKTSSLSPEVAGAGGTKWGHTVRSRASCHLHRQGAVVRLHSIRKTRVRGDHSCPLPPRGGRGQGQPTEEGSKVAALRRGNYPLVSQAAESGHRRMQWTIAECRRRTGVGDRVLCSQSCGPAVGTWNILMAHAGLKPHPRTAEGLCAQSVNPCPVLSAHTCTHTHIHTRVHTHMHSWSV